MSFSFKNCFVLFVQSISLYSLWTFSIEIMKSFDIHTQLCITLPWTCNIFGDNKTNQTFNWLLSKHSTIKTLIPLQLVHNSYNITEAIKRKGPAICKSEKIIKWDSICALIQMGIKSCVTCRPGRESDNWKFSSAPSGSQKVTRWMEINVFLWLLLQISRIFGKPTECSRLRIARFIWNFLWSYCSLIFVPGFKLMWIPDLGSFLFIYYMESSATLKFI